MLFQTAYTQLQGQIKKKNLNQHKNHQKKQPTLQTLNLKSAFADYLSHWFTKNCTFKLLSYGRKLLLHQTSLSLFPSLELMGCIYIALSLTTTADKQHKP